MDPIDYFRGEIKSYFPESCELNLSDSYARHRRFNFYFKIKADFPFLLYLNWDGESDRFTIKCLEFRSAEILSNLIKSYPETGSKTFNIGQPKSTVSFIYRGGSKLSVTDVKGSIPTQVSYDEIPGDVLMVYIDPVFDKNDNEVS